MYKSNKIKNFFKFFILSIFPFIIMNNVNAEVKVVTTIQPLHSLISNVMGNKGKLDLILEGTASPHSFTLKPSHAKMLENADVIFWVDKDLESFLEKPLKSIPKKAKVIHLMDLSNLEIHKFREKNIYGGHDDHDDHDKHGHKEDKHAKHDDHDKHGHKEDKHAKHDDHDKHGHGKGAFEWAGLFELKAGTYNWSFSKVDGGYADPAMKMVIIETKDIHDSEELAEKLLEANTSDNKSNGSVLTAKDVSYTLNFDDSKNVTSFKVEIKKDSKYAFFTEHMPFEFEANEHFFKDKSGNDIEPIAQEPSEGGGHHHGHAHAHGEFDVHIWLDPNNAKVIVKEVANELATIDPKNSNFYKMNAKKTIKKLDILINQIDKSINKKASFVTFHDAYQYFEKRFGVEALGALTINTDIQPGAKQIAEIKDLVEDKNIKCIFSEPQFNPKLINMIAKSTGAETGILDPLGSSFKPGENLYFNLINDLYENLNKC
jgi:zinc/manganese transport system substrate-binding protein